MATSSSLPRVVIVGSINKDLVVRVNQLPRIGETVHASSFTRGPGGKGANQAIAVARLGGAASMIGRLGDDAYGSELQSALITHGVDASRVEVLENCSSGVAVAAVDRDGENAIIVYGGANQRLTPSDVQSHEALIAEADALLMQLESPMETVAAAAEIARRHGVLTVLDPAPAPRAALPPILASVDVLTPNHTEAENLAGIRIEGVEDAKLAAQTLHRRGAACVVITLGSDGAVLCDRGELTHVPALPNLKIVDVTGAGDAFAAALTVQLARGTPAEKAVRYACVAGGLMATRHGAAGALPSAADVRKVLDADPNPWPATRIVVHDEQPSIAVPTPKHPSLRPRRAGETER